MMSTYPVRKSRETETQKQAARCPASTDEGRAARHVQSQGGAKHLLWLQLVQAGAGKGRDEPP